MGELIGMIVNKKGQIVSFPLINKGDGTENGRALCAELYNRLKVNAPFEEFAMGMEEEHEHEDITQGDMGKTALIVLAHLKEDKNYYSKLKSALGKGGPGSGRRPEGFGSKETAPKTKPDPKEYPKKRLAVIRGVSRTFGRIPSEKQTNEIIDILHSKRFGKSLKKGGPGSGRKPEGGSKKETDAQRIERLKTVKNPNNPFYEKPSSEEYKKEFDKHNLDYSRGVTTFAQHQANLKALNEKHGIGKMTKGGPGSGRYPKGSGESKEQGQPKNNQEEMMTASPEKWAQVQAENVKAREDREASSSTVPSRMKMMTQEVANNLPKMRTYENAKPEDVPVAVKFFDPTGSWTWYATEGEKTGEKIAQGAFKGEDDYEFFGYVKGFEGELGYFTLGQLSTAKEGQTGMRALPIERDRHYKGTLADAMKD